MNETINTTIRAMLIDLVNQIIKRPLYMVVSKDDQKNPFDSLKNKLESNDSLTLNQFVSPIKEFFDEAKLKKAKYVSDAAIVLENFFDKKIKLICSFNNYCFRDVLSESAQKAFPNVESFYQASDDNKLTKDSETSNIPHRGKKSSKTVRVIRNEKQESDDGDDNDNDDSYGS